MDRTDIAVIIPCFNEEKTIGDVVKAASNYATVFVVDDGSMDSSREISMSQGATVINNEGRTGYEGAIDRGLKFAFNQKFKWIVTLDADGEHDPHVLRDLVPMMRAPNQGLICGVRKKPQRFAEYILCGYVRNQLGINDILCGLKAYSFDCIKLYLNSGRANLINMVPAILWVLNKGTVSQISISGAVRLDRPRFGSLVTANIIILKALFNLRQIMVSRSETA